jgi:hypothetical protein
MQATLPLNRGRRSAHFELIAIGQHPGVHGSPVIRHGGFSVRRAHQARGHRVDEITQRGQIVGNSIQGCSTEGEASFSGERRPEATQPPHYQAGARRAHH